MPEIRLVTHLFLVGFCFFVAACAPMQDKPADFKSAPDGPAGYATLYVFRPFQVIGRGRSPITYINDQKIVDLKAGSYTVIYVKPGQYHIDTKDGSLLGGTYNKIIADIDISLTTEYYLLLDQIATPHTNLVVMPMGATSAAFVESANTVDSLQWTLTTNRYDRMRIRDCYYIPPDTSIFPG